MLQNIIHNSISVTDIVKRLKTSLFKLLQKKDIHNIVGLSTRENTLLSLTARVQSRMVLYIRILCGLWPGLDLLSKKVIITMDALKVFCIVFALLGVLAGKMLIFCI